MQQKVRTMQQAITPSGSRPPFTRKRTNKEIFQWWMTHWNDSLGQAERAKLTPQQVQELYTWLTQAVNHPTMLGGPAKLPPVSEPTPNQVIGPAQRAERRIEGAPVGSEVS